jgi:hypothetical protein
LRNQKRHVYFRGSTRSISSGKSSCAPCIGSSDRTVETEEEEEDVSVRREGTEVGIVASEFIVDGAAVSVEATPAEDDAAAATEEMEMGMETTLFGGGGPSALRLEASMF